MLQLRITTTPETIVLGLHGRIVGDEVGFLEQEGQKRMCPSSILEVNLDDVAFIDRAGVSLLRRWAEQGVRINGGSPFIRALLQAAASQQ